LPDAVERSLISAVMICEHKRIIESDEFLSFRGRLCSLTSATFLFLPTFSRTILSYLKVCNFQLSRAFRSVFHYSRIKKNIIFLHLYMIREKCLLASLFLPVRLSVCMSAYIRAIFTALIFVEFDIVDLHESLSKIPRFG
jgi:hypothetical protein